MDIMIITNKQHLRGVRGRKYKEQLTDAEAIQFVTKLLRKLLASPLPQLVENYLHSIAVQPHEPTRLGVERDKSEQGDVHTCKSESIRYKWRNKSAQ